MQVDYVVRLCRNACCHRGGSDAFSPRCSHRAHTTFTPGGATYMLHGSAREGRPRISSRRMPAGTHVAFSFPTYCIERPRASTCARVSRCDTEQGEGPREVFET